MAGLGKMFVQQKFSAIQYQSYYLIFMIERWSYLQLPPALVLAVVPQPVQVVPQPVRAKGQSALELTAEQCPLNHGNRQNRVWMSILTLYTIYMATQFCSSTKSLPNQWALYHKNIARTVFIIVLIIKPTFVHNIVHDLCLLHLLHCIKLQKLW